MSNIQLEQDRRDAEAWATEWRIRRKNRRLIRLGAVVLVIAALYMVISYVTIRATRTTFESEEAMRSALQGRFETNYAEDIEITGDNLKLTYYEISHYDPDFARRYGYSEYGDDVFTDVIEKWDYRRGLIKGRWMNEIIVDKNGNLVYYEQTFSRSDGPRPEPFDVSILDEEDSESEASGDDETVYGDNAASANIAYDEDTGEALEVSHMSRERTKEDYEYAEDTADTSQ